MAKKNSAQSKAVVPTVEPVKIASPQAVAVRPTGVLPSLEGASPELKARMLEIKDNLESVENFQLPRAKMTASGIVLVEGEPPLLELEGVIIHTKKTNVYYDKPYNKNDIQPPTCFSLDGVTPDKSIHAPQNKTCKGCKWAEFGTNQMGSGKACRNLKPMFILLSDDAILPRQFNVTPSSLKAANQYLLDLTERGMSYRKVKSKIQLYKKQPDDTFYTVKFSVSGKLNEQQIGNAEFIKNQLLPLMNAQLIDQSELDSGQNNQAPAVTGEF